MSLTPGLLRLLRAVSALLVLILAAYGLYALLRGRDGQAPPRKIETVALSPVSRGEILNEFRLITVERQYRIPVLGRSYKPLPEPGSGVMAQFARDLLGGRESVPGTTTNLVYEMVTTVTMGIDLAKLAEQDIQNGETVTTVTLPTPEVMSVVHDPTKSRIFAQERPSLPYLDNSAQLLEELQKTGTLKHRAEAESDEALMARAKNEAERSLKSLLERVHPGREIRILFESEQKNPLPAP